MSKELRIHQLDMNPPPPTSENCTWKSLVSAWTRGQCSIILPVKRDTIIKLENAVNVESSMDGTVAHLFKRKREREKDGRNERKNKRQTFAPELSKSGLQWISSHCPVKLYPHLVFNNLEGKISFSGLHTKTKRCTKGSMTTVVQVHTIHLISE